MNILKRQRTKGTYAQMKDSPNCTATINKRKDVKKKRLYESSFDKKVSNLKLLTKMDQFLFWLYLIVVYTGHQLYI